MSDWMNSTRLVDVSIEMIENELKTNPSWDGSPILFAPGNMSWITKNEDAFPEGRFLFTLPFDYNGEKYFLFHGDRQRTP